MIADETVFASNATTLILFSLDCCAADGLLLPAFCPVRFRPFRPLLFRRGHRDEAVSLWVTRWRCVAGPDPVCPGAGGRPAGTSRGAEGLRRPPRRCRAGQGRSSGVRLQERRRQAAHGHLHAAWLLE